MRCAFLTSASTNLRMHHWMHLELGNLEETWLQTLFDPFDVGPAQDENSIVVCALTASTVRPKDQRYS